MKTLSFWTNISALMILGITISFSPSILSFSPAIATPLYVAQYNPSPEEQALVQKVQSLLKEQEQLIFNTQQKIFLILTPEQQQEFLLATKGKREPMELLSAILDLKYNDTQTYVVKTIIGEASPKMDSLSKQILPLMNQLAELHESHQHQ
ncbi:MAG: hypothetical protein ACKO1W_10510 [Microcystaceae cyanobacterium]